MPTSTENIGLQKAAGTEYYSVAIVNQNLDAIDSAIGDLQDAVGTGGDSNINEKIGENTDTTAGTLFGDLSIVKAKGIQNGTDIAAAKTVADGNATKLTNLRGVADNTKTVVDVVNTNVETVKTTVSTINSRTATTNTNLNTANGKLDTISGKVDAVGTTATNTKTVVDTIKADTTEIKAAVASDTGKVDAVDTKVVGVRTVVDGISTTATNTKTVADSIAAKIGTASDTGSNTLFGALNSGGIMQPFGYAKQFDNKTSGSEKVIFRATGQGELSKLLINGNGSATAVTIEIDGVHIITSQMGIMNCGMIVTDEIIFSNSNASVGYYGFQTLIMNANGTIAFANVSQSFTFEAGKTFNTPIKLLIAKPWKFRQSIVVKVGYTGTDTNAGAITAMGVCTPNTTFTNS